MKSMPPIDREKLEKALLTPSSVFEAPLDVAHHPQLSVIDKIKILKQWELDSRALQRASEESMTGGEQSRLDEVNNALAIVDPANTAEDGFGDVPTKI